VSSTLSEADQPKPGGPPGPGKEPVQPAASAPAGAAGRRSRPHIVAFDLIRLIIMVFVVSVHVLSLAGGTVTMSVGAVTTIFHTSRELFILLTALVLTYNYGKRPRIDVPRFWWRRFYLVVPAYVAWSAIYYAADGHARGPFPSAFLHDLGDAGARYHLYFLLVSMQVYLLFPLIRWVLRKTERWHAWLFGLFVAYQLWLTVALHYHAWRTGNTDIIQFLNGAATGNYVTTYLLYVVAGALAGWHFEKLSAVTRRVLSNGWKVAGMAALGVAGGICAYLIETLVYNATPNNASAVFQPVVVWEALTLGWALLGLGLLWSDRGAPGRKFAAAGSASSFGIYLAHPRLRQVLLLFVGASYFGAHGGLTGDLHRMPHSSLEVVILLFIGVPVVYAIAWMIASAVRRTPLSLPLTGREYTPRGGREKLQHRVALFLAPLPPVRLLTRGSRVVLYDAPARIGRMSRRSAIILTAVAVVAAAGAVTAVQIDAAVTRTINYSTASTEISGLNRSYTTLTPAKATLAADAPIIVALSGLNSTQDQEIGRDELTSYVQAGDAEVVYPLAYRESWNVIGCCSWAHLYNVNDLGFIKALVQQVDPGHTRPIYVMGYSNGGRLAYALACTDPTLFDGYAIVKADPPTWCQVSADVKILQVASTDDTDVPYQPGEKGTESPAETVQMTRLRQEEECTSKTSSASAGNMTLTTWTDCLQGGTVSLALYTAGVHSYPRPPVSFPAASQVIWAWINNTVTVQAQPKAR
jgi:poly(3-hydroxybutyrate) depolymerase/peptidoglycan/LPS O-acetylase OafA/YrhL